jgi:hypothetical protein
MSRKCLNDLREKNVITADLRSLFPSKIRPLKGPLANVQRPHGRNDTMRRRSNSLDEAHIPIMNYLKRARLLKARQEMADLHQVDRLHSDFISFKDDLNPKQGMTLRDKNVITADLPFIQQPARRARTMWRTSPG